MAAGRLWSAISGLIWSQPTATAVANAPGELKAAVPTPRVEPKELSDTVGLPANSMDRLKQQLADYEAQFDQYEKEFRQLNNKIMLLQKSAQTKYEGQASNTLNVSRDTTKRTNDLKDIIQAVKKEDEPLIVGLLKNTNSATTLEDNLTICTQAMDLIEKLDQGMVQVKTSLRNKQQLRDAIHKLWTIFLAWKFNIPDLTPPDHQEAKDDELYIAMKPIMSGFFNWLDKIKMDLQRIEQHVQRFLAENQADETFELVKTQKEEEAEAVATETVQTIVDNAMRSIAAADSKKDATKTPPSSPKGGTTAQLTRIVYVDASPKAADPKAGAFDGYSLETLSWADLPPDADDLRSLLSASPKTPTITGHLRLPRDLPLLDTTRGSPQSGASLSSPGRSMPMPPRLTLQPIDLSSQSAQQLENSSEDRLRRTRSL